MLIKRKKGVIVDYEIGFSPSLFFYNLVFDNYCVHVCNFKIFYKMYQKRETGKESNAKRIREKYN